MLIKRKENIFGDNIAYLESYAFSKANMSNETSIWKHRNTNTRCKKN